MRPSWSQYDRAVAEDVISLTEAARISGVSASTLKRWARARVIPVRDGRWTTAAAAQARVVARMRERHSWRIQAPHGRSVRDGRLAFGYVEDLIPGARERPIGRAEAAAQTGLEEELIERVMTLLGTPTALEGTLNEQDVNAIKSMGAVLGAHSNTSITFACSLLDLVEHPRVLDEVRR